MIQICEENWRSEMVEKNIGVVGKEKKNYSKILKGLK